METTIRVCRTPLSLLATAILLLTGRPVVAQAPIAISNLTVQVQSGAVPIASARLQLYQADLTSDTPSSTPLLPYLAYTNANGGYTLSGLTCTPGALYYLTVTGGDTGSGNNPAIALMTAVGSCNTLAITSTIVLNEVTTVASVYALSGFMTSLTSVGAKATPTGGANDALLTSNALSGITNAFATANNLVDITTGIARTATVPGNGTVPQSEIDTLADALAACVQSSGFSSSGCTTLIADTPSKSGIAPTQTVQAALNIAHNPSANVAALYTLASTETITSPPCKTRICTFARLSIQPAYSPVLAASPNDWSVFIAYTGGGVSNPTGMAIDAVGNVWIANNGLATNTSTISEFANNGTVLSGTGYTAPSFSFANGIAIDLSGDAWVPAYGSENVVKFSPGGSVLFSYTNFNFENVRGVSIDGSGNIWIPLDGSSHTSSITKFDSSGNLLTGIPGYPIPNSATPFAIAIDQMGAAWIANSGERTIAKLDAQGNLLSGTNGFSSGATNGSPYSIAIDASGDAWAALGAQLVGELSPSGTSLSGTGGFPSCVPQASDSTYTCVGVVAVNPYLGIDGAGNIWVPFGYSAAVLVQGRLVYTTHYGLAELNHSGAIISGPTGYATDGQNTARRLAIDNSGNVWDVTNQGSLRELIGAAVPVATPLAAGVKTGALGSRP